MYRMWDSRALQGSILRSSLTSDPRSFRGGPLPGCLLAAWGSLPGRRPRACPCGLAGTIRRPSRESTNAATAVALPGTRYRNKAGESRSSLASATARPEVPSGFPYASSRTLHRADSPALSTRVSGPSCASRRLFRRHHLRRRPGLAGHVGRLSWDFQRSPLRRTLPESPLPCGIAAVTSGRTEPPFVLVPSPRSLTALTAFASPTLHVCCNVLPTVGFVVFRAACEAVSPPRVPALRSLLPAPSSSPPLSWRSAGRRHQDRLSPGCSPPAFPPHPSPSVRRTHRWASIAGAGVRPSQVSRISSRTGLVAPGTVAGEKRSILPWACRLLPPAPLARRRLANRKDVEATRR